jgi:hypothetical protein
MCGFDTSGVRLYFIFMKSHSKGIALVKFMDLILPVSF